MDGTNRASVIAASLKGKQICVPNLRLLFSRWPTEVSPHLDELEATVDQKLLEWIPDAKLVEKSKKFNLPLFASTWWPTATRDRLEIIIYYIVWSFIWDDVHEEADNSEPGTSGDQDIAARNKQALAFVAYQLGLCDENAPEPAAPTAYTELFRVPGRALKEACDKASRKRLLDELKFTLDCFEVEENYLQSDTLPSITEYWENRRGTSGVNTYSALAEYMMDTKIPESLFETDDLKTMWSELNRNITTVNDILSLKKELCANKSSHSLVPVTLNETGLGVQSIVDKLVADIESSNEAFDKAANKFLAVMDGDDYLNSAKHRYVNLLRMNMTGNLEWSLATDRYGMPKYLQQDGSLVITL